MNTKTKNFYLSCDPIKVGLTLVGFDNEPMPGAKGL
jgi:hypothetical protein